MATNWGIRIKGQDAVRKTLLGLEIDLGNADKILRTGVFDLYAQVSQRIQQQGRATSGALIGGGQYSKGWGYKRRKAGRQTAFIDLTFSGDLLDRGFIPGPTPSGGFGLGFVNGLEKQKADWLEQQFGKVFTPQQKEKDQAFTYILQAIQNEIRKRSRGR